MTKTTLNLKQYMEEQTPLETRSGDKAFIFKFNKWHPYPFIGAVITEDNVFVCSWNFEGSVYAAEKPHIHDIVGLWRKLMNNEKDILDHWGETTKESFYE